MVQISRLRVNVEEDHDCETSSPATWSLMRVESHRRDVQSCIKVSWPKSCAGGEEMRVPRSPDLREGNGSLWLGVFAG